MKAYKLLGKNKRQAQPFFIMFVNPNVIEISEMEI